MTKAFLVLGLAGCMALAGCGGGSDDGSPTAEENRQLNEAAEMLDTSPDDLIPAEEAALGNGEEDVATENDAAGNEAAGNAAGNGQ